MVEFSPGDCDFFRWFGGFVPMGLVMGFGVCWVCLVVSFGACCGEDDDDDDDEVELVRAKGFGKLELRACIVEMSESDSVRRAFSEVGGGAVQLGFGYWVLFGFELLGGGGWCDLVDQWWLWVVAVGCSGSGWFGFWV